MMGIDNDINDDGAKVNENNDTKVNTKQLFTFLIPFCTYHQNFVLVINTMENTLPDAQLRLHLSTPNKLLINLFQMPS